MKSKLKQPNVIKCPYCHMPPFTHCVTKAGDKLSHYHAARKSAAKIKIAAMSQAEVKAKLKAKHVIK